MRDEATSGSDSHDSQQTGHCSANHGHGLGVVWIEQVTVLANKFVKNVPRIKGSSTAVPAEPQNRSSVLGELGIEKFRTNEDEPPSQAEISVRRPPSSPTGWDCVIMFV